MFRAFLDRIWAWTKDALNPIEGFVSVIRMIWMFICAMGSGQITFSGVTRGGRRFNFRRVNLLGILLFSFFITFIIGYYLRSSPQSTPAQPQASTSSNQEIEQLRNENASLRKDLELARTSASTNSNSSANPTTVVATPCADKAELENCRESNTAILQESKELQSQLKAETVRAGNLQQQLVQSPTSNSFDGSDQQMQPPKRSDGLTQLQRDQAEAARKRGGG